MRSVKMWSGARVAAVLGLAIGAAGGCTHAGSYDPGVPYSGFAFAGDGPSCHIPDLAGARDHWVATPASTPGTGVGCMNAVMTVTAREIASEAAALAAREARTIRARLSRARDFARLSAAEQDRIIDAATDALQREWFARLERAAAAEVSRLEQRLARFAADPPGAGTPAAHVERQMRENLHASERAWLAARRPAPTCAPG